MRTNSGHILRPGPLASRSVLGMRVDATSREEASTQIIRWAKEGEPRYVCVAAVNNVMHAHDDPRFLDVMNRADLVTPDGVPLVWALRRMGITGATRVYGPELTESVLDLAADEGLPVGVYGGAPGVLPVLLSQIAKRWPGVRVAYAFSPPFRVLSPDEDAAIVESIRSSGVRVLFVGLGCPKQEIWMSRHVDHIPAVLVGVGAAFDFLAGTKKQAPGFMQRLGLEWLFRLATEPRRLWRRYLSQNPRFVVLLVRQLIRTEPRDRHAVSQRSLLTRKG